MNPIDQKIIELQRQIDEIRQMRNLQLTENIKRYTLDGVLVGGIISAASTADVNETFAPGAGATVARDYDDKILITIGGTDYYLGLYQI